MAAQGVMETARGHSEDERPAQGVMETARGHSEDERPAQGVMETARGHSEDERPAQGVMETARGHSEDERPAPKRGLIKVQQNLEVSLPKLLRFHCFIQTEALRGEKWLISVYM